MYTHSRPILTEISRSIGDNSFSDFELFYRFFEKMPLVSFQAGATDLYDRPARSVAEMLDDDDDEKESPHKGEDELNAAVNKFFQHLKLEYFPSTEYNGDQHDNDDINVSVAKYVNFESNVFMAHICFHQYDIIVRLRVAPGKTETLTSMAMLGINERSRIWQHIVAYCKKLVTPPQARIDEINIITQSNGDFYLKAIPLASNKKAVFSFDNYNEGFEEISTNVLNALQSDEHSNGLVLFHGDPGTGKTSYLKYMLHTISKKKLIYLPPDLIEHLSSPNFVTFLMSQAMNSILLIEDAENVLKHREVGGSQAVSNILNISDGILGDVLRLKIVCTFNSPLDQIDPALLREGRLICEYRFEKLNEAKTAFLMKKLYGEDVTWDQDEMSIAEIFNYTNKAIKSKDKKQKLGFT